MRKIQNYWFAHATCNWVLQNNSNQGEMLKLRAKNFSILWLEKMIEQMNNLLRMWLSL